MKKTIFSILCLVFLLFCFTACQPRYVIWPIINGSENIEQNPSTYNVSDFESLKNVVANAVDGSTIYLDKVSLNPSTQQNELPIILGKNINITGNLDVSEAGSKAVSGNLETSSINSSYIFKIDDSASVSFSDFDVTIAASFVSSIKAIVSVNGGNLQVKSFSVSAGEDSVAAIEIGKSATAESISISSSSVKVLIDEENNSANAIIAEIQENNPASAVAVTSNNTERWSFSDDGNGGVIIAPAEGVIISGSINIPSEFNGLPVTGIAEGAFNLNTEITSVNIPSSVKVIGDSAFANCTGLTSVTFNEGLEEIGFAAFVGCENIDEDILDLPSTLKTIHGKAFASCYGIKNYIIPSGTVIDCGGNVYDCPWWDCFGWLDENTLVEAYIFLYDERPEEMEDFEKYIVNECYATGYVHYAGEWNEDSSNPQVVGN